MNKLIISCAVLCTLWSSLIAQTADTLLNMKTGSWYAVPSSHMRDVAPPDNFLGKDYEFNYYSLSVIGAWSGGAFDTKRNRHVLWGGGHNNYYGNELYAFDVEDLQWYRITDPDTGFTYNNQDCPEITTEGNPTSRHTYGGLAYIEHTDRFWAHGGSLACGPGESSIKTWTFNFNDTTWYDMDPSGYAPDWDVLQEYSAYDSTSGLVFFFWHGQLFSYDYDANQFNYLVEDQISWAEKGCAIDTKRRLLIVVGNGEVVAYNIDDPDHVTKEEWTTTGGDSIVNVRAPGLEYDPVADEIVAWNYGSYIYKLDVETKTWSRIEATGGPEKTSTYVYGRFRYVPDYNVFIAVSHIDENVHFFKNSPGGTGPVVTSDEKREFFGNAGLEIFPNPVRKAALITFRSNGNSYAEITLLDVQGRMVRRIFSGPSSAGMNKVPLEITNTTGSLLANGIYIVKLQLGTRTYTEKMMITDH